MESLLLFAYEFSVETVPFVIVLAVIAKQERKRGTPFKKRDVIIKLLLGLYIFAVLSVTGAGTIYELFRLKITPQSPTELRQLNLVPFSNGIDILTILNVVMLVPFGFMLPVLWKRNGRMYRVILSGFAFSMLIELSQLMNNRCRDIDDLIANTLGAVIGYIIYKVFAEIFGLKRIDEHYTSYEPMLYVLVMILGRFLFFNEFGAAKLIFGF